jgi:hypothetical protein
MPPSDSKTWRQEKDLQARAVYVFESPPIHDEPAITGASQTLIRAGNCGAETVSGDRQLTRSARHLFSSLICMRIRAAKEIRTLADSPHGEHIFPSTRS